MCGTDEREYSSGFDSIGTPYWNNDWSHHPVSKFKLGQKAEDVFSFPRRSLNENAAHAHHTSHRFQSDFGSGKTGFSKCWEVRTSSCCLLPGNYIHSCCTRDYFGVGH